MAGVVVDSRPAYITDARQAGGDLIYRCVSGFAPGSKSDRKLRNSLNLLVAACIRIFAMQMPHSILPPSCFLLESVSWPRVSVTKTDATVSSKQ